MGATCPSCGSAVEPDATECFSCGRSLVTPSATIGKGSVIADRYEILERLGRGGMGAVYRARDRVLEDDVALKVLRDEVSSSSDMTRRFRAEIRLARKVTHRNVCRIHEYGEEKGRAYISMEIVKGRDLKHMIRDSGGLPWPLAFDLALQIAEGLAAIHAVGIVHRDLKPPNVMVDETGTARLMDFGIAKQIQGGLTSTGATATGVVMGTPDYMSPEQAQAQKVDHHSDIYALGVMIFEMFTGRLPFSADTPMAVILKHITTPPPLEGEEAARIPKPLLPVLARALAKDPAARQDDVRELIADLTRARDESASLTEWQETGTMAEAAVPATPPAGSASAPATPAPTVRPVSTRVSGAGTGAQATAPRITAASSPAGRAPTGVFRPTVPLPAAPAPRRPSTAIVIGVAALVVAAAVGGWRLTRPKPEPATSPGPAASPAAATPAARAPAPGAPVPVTVNALPWARVRLRPLAYGVQVPALEESQRTTPLLLALPPGEYTVELETGGLTPPLTDRIRVLEGSPNDFAFTMPGYDPARVAAAAVRQ